MMLSSWRLGVFTRVLAYTVHEPPHPADDRIDRAQQLVFVRDGFSWAALIFGPLWLLFNRMWLALLVYLLAAVAIGTLFELLGLPEMWASLAGIALNLMLALEADSVRRWTLARRGWRIVGTVVGRTPAECERRFFESWLPIQPERHSPAPTPAGIPPILPQAGAGAGTSAGFFPSANSAAASAAMGAVQHDTRSRLARLFGRKS